MTEYSISYRLIRDIPLEMKEAVVPTHLLFEASAELVNQMLVISKLQNALNTEETGDALIEVARNAHKAEQELSALKRKLEEEFDDEVDINNEGGPNSAMRVMMIVKGEG